MTRGGGRTLYGFDTETTGTDPFTDRIITAAVVKVTDGEVVDKREWMIAPEVEVSEGAFNAHGISTEQARAQGLPPMMGLGGPDGIGEIVTGILNAQAPLVVFNAAFDLTLLEVELNRWGLPQLTHVLPTEAWHSVIDPMVIAKGVAKDNREFHNLKGGMLKLPALCQRYGVPFTESHDATADAAGATLLACAIAEKYNALGVLSAAELHERQVAWRQRDQQSFREWIAKQTPEKQATYTDVDDGWPIHSRLRGRSVSTTTFKKPAGARS